MTITEQIQFLQAECDGLEQQAQQCKLEQCSEIYREKARRYQQVIDTLKDAKGMLMHLNSLIVLSKHK